MCDNPLSPELKDALIADQDRSLSLTHRLGIDQIQAAIAAGANPALAAGLLTSLRPYSSTITALVLSEATAKENLNA